VDLVASWVTRRTEGAFQCELDGGEVLEVELAVAPDIAVTLSPPTSLRRRTGKRTGGKRHQVVQSRSESEPAAGELDTLRRDLAVLRQTLEEEQLRTTQPQQELEHAGLAKAEVAAALSRRDAPSASWMPSWRSVIRPSTNVRRWRARATG
jgi:hypothetical protein